MRRLTLTLLATTAAIGLAASVASAADLPRKAPAPVLPPPPPPYNWTGLYVGGSLGAGWARNQFTQGFCDAGTGDIQDICTEFLNGAREGNSFALGSHNGLGIVGGGQIGYNWQFPNSPIVVGLEGAYLGADLKGDHQNAVTFGTSTTFFGQERIFSKTKGIALITARLGLASGPQDRTLWYVKGGGAWAKTDLASAGSWIEKEPGETAQHFTGAFSGTSNRWGWTVGTGVELGLWDNWTARIEYDYLDFGNHTIAFNGFGTSIFEGECLCETVTGGVARNINLKQQIHLITVGLNYRFNWWR